MVDLGYTSSNTTGKTILTKGVGGSFTYVVVEGECLPRVSFPENTKTTFSVVTHRLNTEDVLQSDKQNAILSGIAYP